MGVALRVGRAATSGSAHFAAIFPEPFRIDRVFV